MLRPQRNACRDCIDLSGIWDAELADGMSWQLGVPASWNEQRSQLRDHFGSVIYRRTVWLPREWSGERDIVLRLDAAAYRARAWVNGELMGGADVGYLPWEIDVSAAAKPGADNEIAIEVDATLGSETIPQGGIGARLGFMELRRLPRRPGVPPRGGQSQGRLHPNPRAEARGASPARVVAFDISSARLEGLRVEPADQGNPIVPGFTASRAESATGHATG